MESQGETESMKIMEGIVADISQSLSRPVYFQFEAGRARRIEFLTPSQVAELLHVEVRTVYSWIERWHPVPQNTRRAHDTI